MVIPDTSSSFGYQKLCGEAVSLLSAVFHRPSSATCLRARWVRWTRWYGILGSHKNNGFFIAVSLESKPKTPAPTSDVATLICGSSCDDPFLLGGTMDAHLGGEVASTEKLRNKNRNQVNKTNQLSY